MTERPTPTVLTDHEAIAAAYANPGTPYRSTESGDTFQAHAGEQPWCVSHNTAIADCHLITTDTDHPLAAPTGRPARNPFPAIVGGTAISGGPATIERHTETTGHQKYDRDRDGGYLWVCRTCGGRFAPPTTCPGHSWADDAPWRVTYCAKPGPNCAYDARGRYTHTEEAPA